MPFMTTSCEELLQKLLTFVQQNILGHLILCVLEDLMNL